MARLKINAKIKQGLCCKDLDGFCDFTEWTSARGEKCTNKIVTIYSLTGEITYPKLTQEVLDCILKMACKGQIEIIEKYD